MKLYVDDEPIELTEEEVQRLRDYAHVFGSDIGKRVLEDLGQSFFMERSTFVPGDPHKTAFNEGSRDVVLSIYRVLSLGKRPHSLPGAGPLSSHTSADEGSST